MATGKWIIAEDIRECGCLMIGYLNEDDTTRVDMHYCPKHKAAPEMYEASRGLALSLPDSELDLAREVWGHTNVAVVTHWRDKVLATLADGSDA